MSIKTRLKRLSVIENHKENTISICDARVHETINIDRLIRTFKIATKHHNLFLIPNQLGTTLIDSDVLPQA
jgi:hypothetical protein